jgi:N6-adenosine-specific RNA methylase IME4
MSISATDSMPFSKRRKYGVIYADPPWSFRNWSAKGTGRNAISHYDCLDFAALTSLPVASLAADNCALFLVGHRSAPAPRFGAYRGLGL